MPAVPVQLEDALRGIGCVTVKVKDDPVNVALHKEFQHLLHLLENWDTTKKKDRRKNAFEPEARARNAAETLKERQMAAEELVAQDEKGAEQPSSSAGEPEAVSADEALAPIPAEKRSRVVSEVPESKGASDLPAARLTPTKPRTKAARTRAKKQKEQPTGPKFAASAPQEIPQEPEDVQHQPEDASAAAAPAELPVDEEMVPVDDHDATVVSAEEVQAAEIPESADAETNFEVLPASTTCEPSASEHQSLPVPCSATPSASRPSHGPLPEEQQQCNALSPVADIAVPVVSPAQEDPEDEVMQQSPDENAGTATQSASPDAMGHEELETANGTPSAPVEEEPAVDAQPASEPASASAPASKEPAGSAEPPVVSDAAPAVVEDAQVAGVPNTAQVMNDVVMTPIACDNDDLIETPQVASLGPCSGPNISAQVQATHQYVASVGTDSIGSGGQGAPAPELTLSQVPALQVVDNPLQAVTPVAFGSQPRSQVTASPAPQSEAMPQSMAAAAYGSRSPRPRRSSVHVTAAAECVKSPRVTGSFSVGGLSAQRDRGSQPIVLQPQPSPLRQGSMPFGGPSNVVAGPERTPPSFPSIFALNSHPIAVEEQPAAFQHFPVQASAPSSPRNASSSMHAASLVQGSFVNQSPTMDPVASMDTAKGALANVPLSAGPTSAGPQWPAHTPILHDEGDGAEEEGIPAWSSDGGSADENAGAAGGAQVPEDELPFCDERADANVVDMHELEPHETPSPLPEGVWSQVAEQAAEAELSGLQGVSEDDEGKRSTSSTPKFCAGDAGGTQDFSQPVSRGPTFALPLMDSQQTVRSPLAECHLADADAAMASQEGLPPIMENNSQNVQPGFVLSPVEVDQGQASELEVATEHAEEKESDAVPSCTDVSGEAEAVEPKQEAAAGTSGMTIGQGGLLAQIRSKMIAQKAAEKDFKPSKQPIAALAKAAKAKQEQLKVQEDREARKKALEKERAAQKHKATVPFKQPVSAKETRIPTTPTARKVLQDLKKAQGTSAVHAFVPACKTPGPYPASTLHNNVNATPRAQATLLGLAGTATPRKWRAPTPGPQYPITPEDELEDSDDEDVSEAREQKTAKFQAPWATSEKLKQAVRVQKYINPEAVFGSFEPSCNLMDMMAPAKNEKEEFKYTVRRKSRNWGGDAITQAEIDSFSRKKGYRQI